MPLETGSGAPCQYEGGFKGRINEVATVAVCCANHCGSINTPTGVSTQWSPHPGTFSITQHDGEPCTFYETRLQPGEYNICCKTCWATGLFLARPSDRHLSAQNAYPQGQTYNPEGPLPCSSVQQSNTGARKTTTMALVSVVIDNSGTTYCNGQLLGVANAWNKADTYTCNAIDNNYIIAIDGVDGEVSRQGVGGMMATVVADNGEVMNSDASWRCWNAEGHRNSQPPANWMEYDFDDSSWPNAASYGRNDGGQTHWAAYIPMQPGYPPTAGHVKPGIADNAEWIWTADPETHNDVYCRGNFYNGGRLPTVAPPPPPVYGSIPPSSSVAMVSVVVDNSGSTYCNGQLLGNENAWNMADTWKCVAVNNDYVIAIDGVDGEVCPGQVCGVGGLMATIVADNGEVLNTDTTWKCWNAEGHRDTQPPGNWMEVDFDDSLWPNAASYGRNDGDETHWSAYVPMPIGYPATAGHVKPGIADNAEWIWSADPETHNDVYCRGKFHRSTMGQG